MPMTVWIILLSAVAYGAGVARLWRHANRIGAGLPVWRAVSFGAALITLAVALASPIDVWADFLFSAHMTQHELLMLVAAPLAAAGRPGLAWLWLLGPGGRTRAGRAISVLRPWWHRVTHPAVVFLLHAAVVWSAHVPSLFNAALADAYVHAGQHFFLFASAVLFWWALVEGRYGRLGYGAAVVFVFGTSLHTGLLGAGFTFAPRVVYEPYEHAARAVGADPLADQQLAGLIMWIPAGAVFLCTALGLFAAWLGASGKRSAVQPRSITPAAVLLAAGVAAPIGFSAEAARSRPTPVVIALAGHIPADASRGITLSAMEAATVASLLGGEIVMLDMRVQPSPDGIIAGPRTQRKAWPRGIPVIWLGSIPGPRTPCDFSLARPKRTDPLEVLWDHSLVRFGAAQLNERFRRAFNQDMPAGSWSGWFAVKALAETLLAAPPDVCAAMTTRRFDGHKGVALRFDGASGGLIQPAYLVREEQGRRVVTEVK